jgi:DNA-binding CsgD family transcriptional regulator
MLLQGAHIALGDEGIVVRQDELRVMIEQAIRARVGESLFVIEHSDDIGSDLLVRFERLREDGAKACFGLQLIRHAPTPGGWSEMLAVHFQLTPKQTQVLMRMISGDSSENIAKAMRISVETVRTHVRDVYAKLRVSSREELFVRVRPFYM